MLNWSLSIVEGQHLLEFSYKVNFNLASFSVFCESKNENFVSKEKLAKQAKGLRLMQLALYYIIAV